MTDNDLIQRARRLASFRVYDDAEFIQIGQEAQDLLAELANALEQATTCPQCGGPVTVCADCAVEDDMRRQLEEIEAALHGLAEGGKQ